MCVCVCVYVCVCVSQVFYTDSLKFFLSLYGHKLPVMSMDISSDNTLLVTASADKNIKVCVYVCVCVCTYEWLHDTGVVVGTCWCACSRLYECLFAHVHTQTDIMYQA